MIQSVVIGLLFSDWSDGSVCCDWSTQLWLVRWPSLLRLVYSALIGQMTQSVVIGLLSFDWSDGSICCDCSTLLWLVRWSSLLWLVYSALIGQMAQSVRKYLFLLLRYRLF